MSDGNICSINDLPLSGISHVSYDSPFIYLKPNAGENFSAADIFYILKSIYKHWGYVSVSFTEIV